MESQTLESRAARIFSGRLHGIYRKTDRLFALLLVVQWVFAVVLALTTSPRSWIVDQPYWHVHLWAALLLGGALTLGPVVCVLTRPGRFSTRLVVTIAQVGYSTLLIHLTGGRIETHFHVFGSLAFLSFYRDWRLFVPATLLVAADHFIRGVLWPESVFGLLTPAPWRALEHAGWVIFEDIFLIWGCLTSVAELREASTTQAELESAKLSVEVEVRERTRELAARTADLASERRLLEGIMQSVADGIIAADDKGEVLCFNRGAEDILGAKTMYDLSSQDWAREYGLFEPDGVTPIAAEDLPLRRAIRGENVANRMLVVRRGCVDRIVSANAQPLMSDSHQGGVVTFRDVTEQERLKEQLAESQKLESIGQLAAGIAHEINTPMQYVIDNVEYLGECSERLFKVVDAYQDNLHQTDHPRSWDARVQELASIRERCRFDHIREQFPLAMSDSREGAKRVIEIVRAMKKLSHPGSLSKVATDLNEAIRTTATVTRNRWKYAAELRLELADEIPRVPVFAAEFNQVLVNLIVNAADAIVEKHGEEGPMGRIVIRTRATLQGVVIEVEDNGCGMPEAVRRKAFDPFYTTKEAGKGTGQGLAITNNVVVNHHNGSIDVRSTLGEGTTFLVELPFGQSDPMHGPSGETRGEPGPEPTTDEQRDAGSGWSPESLLEVLP